MNKIVYIILTVVEKQTCHTHSLSVESYYTVVCIGYNSHNSYKRVATSFDDSLCLRYGRSHKFLVIHRKHTHTHIYIDTFMRPWAYMDSAHTYDTTTNVLEDDSYMYVHVVCGSKLPRDKS